MSLPDLIKAGRRRFVGALYNKYWLKSKITMAIGLLIAHWWLNRKENRLGKKQICLDDLHINHKYTPPQDETFIEKYASYLEGKLPKYLILIRSDYVKPFSLEYYPEEWTPFIPYIESLVEKINAEDFDDFSFPWVYQKGRFFILSDDYPTYYAFLESNKGSMFCHCLGKPNHPELEILKGPFMGG